MLGIDGINFVRSTSTYSEIDLDANGISIYKFNDDNSVEIFNHSSQGNDLISQKDKNNKPVLIKNTNYFSVLPIPINSIEDSINTPLAFTRDENKSRINPSITINSDQFDSNGNAVPSMGSIEIDRWKKIIIILIFIQQSLNTIQVLQF